MKHPSSPYRLLIVDDLPAVREALRWALEGETDLVVVGEASDGPEALACAAALAPDVVLLDLMLPGLDGYAVARALKASAHPPVVVLLAVHDDPVARRCGATVGSDGFAEKSAGWSALLTEVRRALAARSSRKLP